MIRAYYIAAEVDAQIDRLTAERDRLRAALNAIASWGEGERVGPSFDEPFAAATARAALKEKP